MSKDNHKHCATCGEVLKQVDRDNIFSHEEVHNHCPSCQSLRSRGELLIVCSECNSCCCRACTTSFYSIFQEQNFVQLCQKCVKGVVEEWWKNKGKE